MTKADIVEDNMIWTAVMQRAMQIDPCSAHSVSFDTNGRAIPHQILASDVPLPKTICEALNDPVWGAYWREAANKEFQQQIREGVWRLIPRPDGCKVIDSKWEFKVKRKMMAVLTSSNAG